MNIPIRSSQYLAAKDWPSTYRGPIYTRMMSAEAFQHAPMFVFPDGRALGSTDQGQVIAACAKNPYYDDASCASMSRDIGKGVITAAQAQCELNCAAPPYDKQSWGVCVAKCYGAFGKESFISKYKYPLIFGGVAFAGIIGFMLLRKR